MALIRDRGRQSFIQELSRNSTITELQHEGDYDKILTEWKIHRVFSTLEKTHKCICGQSLKNVCVIRNRLTGNNCMVGTDCAEKLMSVDYTGYFHKNLIQSGFIGEFEEQMDEAIRRLHLSSFNIKFMSDMNSKVKKYGSMSVLLSDKQLALYEKIYNEIKAKLRKVPANLPILRTPFELYSEDSKRTLELLVQNEDLIFNDTIFNPVHFSYLVYKGICTEVQYQKYYTNSRYAFLGDPQDSYLVSNKKLSALIQNEISKLKEEITWIQS